MALQTWVRALEYTNIAPGSGPTTLASVLDSVADLHGDRAALIAEEERFNYCELAARSNRYARWTIAQGLGKGDVVCLLMPNCPDYVAIWLGLTRTGCAVALINTNLAGAALLHSIHIARAAHQVLLHSCAAGLVG